jgi:hypothetical protein
MGNIEITKCKVGVFSLYSMDAGINFHWSQIKLIICDPDLSIIYGIIGVIFNLSMPKILGSIMENGLVPWPWGPFVHMHLLYEDQASNSWFNLQCPTRSNNCLNCKLSKGSVFHNPYIDFILSNHAPRKCHF